MGAPVIRKYVATVINSNGVDYYVTSSNLDESELLSVANSIGVLPVGKQLFYIIKICYNVSR